MNILKNTHAITSLFIVSLFLSSHTNASHNGFLDSIDSIDYVFAAGGGSFNGFLDSGNDDDWIVFGANAGDLLTITAYADEYKNMVLLQDVSDGVFTVGDHAHISNFNMSQVGNGDDLKVLSHIGALEFSGNASLNWIAQYTGQYGIGINAPNESSSYAGSWLVTLSGNTASLNEVPVPAAAWLFGSALAGLGVVRRKK